MDNTRASIKIQNKLFESGDQKKVLRFIFFANRNVHAIPLFINANILPISFLYFKSVSYLMHDIHANSAPSKIVNLF